MLQGVEDTLRPFHNKTLLLNTILFLLKRVNPLDDIICYLDFSLFLIRT